MKWNIGKHSTIPYVRYFYSCAIVCNSNFVFKTRRFSDIRLQKCHDLEIWVRGHSRSLKVVPFYRLVSAYVSTVWPRATKFSVVTHMGRGVF